MTNFVKALSAAAAHVIKIQVLMDLKKGGTYHIGS